MPQLQVMQVRTTLRGERLTEFYALANHLGLTHSATLRLAARRLAQSELPQDALYKNTASPDLEEAA